MQNSFNYDDIPVISTTSGRLKGYFFNGEYIFKGIPYATARRFQMPEAVTPWVGVKDATSYGFVAPLLSQDTPNGELLVPHRYWPQDENCLNLNIWTHSLAPTSKKPVLVWFHGGGYTAGSAIEHIAYDGFNMTEFGDVVVVTVNHRLNILGFLDLASLSEKYAHSANVGLADLVASLEWIHDNIVNFGGDPENVTIFGQSGGGMKVTGLMQIPAAAGLFQKGIIMSGVSDGKVMPLLPGDGKAITTALLAELNIQASEFEKLETIPYYELAQAYNKVAPVVAKAGHYVGGMPLADDYYLGEPLVTGFRKEAYAIPLMIGSVFGEFAFGELPFNKETLTYEQARKLIAKVYGKHTDAVLTLFKKAYPDKHITDLLSLDRVFRVPSKKRAQAHAKGQKAPAYLYNFTLNFPIQHGKPAWHCSDIPFVFHNTEKVEVTTIPEVTKDLEQQIFSAVISFAYNSDPNHPNLPTWEPVTIEKEPTMIFDCPCEVRDNYDDDLLDFMEEVLPATTLTEADEAEIQH